MAPQKLGKWMVNPAYLFLSSNILHDGSMSRQYFVLIGQNTTGNSIPSPITIIPLALEHCQHCFVSTGSFFVFLYLILLPLRFQVLRLPLSQPFRPGSLRS